MQGLVAEAKMIEIFKMFLDSICREWGDMYQVLADKIILIWHHGQHRYCRLKGMFVTCAVL